MAKEVDAVVHRLGLVTLHDHKKQPNNPPRQGKSKAPQEAFIGTIGNGESRSRDVKAEESLKNEVPKGMVIGPIDSGESRSRHGQGKPKKAEELLKDEVSEVLVPAVDAVPGGESSDDDDDGEEEQEVLDRSLTNEGAALLAEVEKVLAVGGDLSKLRVDHLKAYLRHHGLRMAGLKAVLLSRIEDHLRLKGGQGEHLYPRSSFRINCRGDVCLDDIVLFLHTVYGNDKFKRHGKPLGDRWVAGRIVNESYGAQKQQHTFTIEVYWSTGIRPFYSMQPILIKGRNLYRMTTLRQPWNNEDVRRKALEEKHARGAEARSQRQKRIETGSSSRGSSRPRPSSNNQAGAIRPPHHTMTFQQSGENARMESNMNVYQGRNPCSVPMASRSSIPAMGCSTQGCERPGALKCKVRSCGPCCYRNTLPRGSCPRHQ